MKKLLILLSAALMLASCSTTKTYSELYYWGGKQKNVSTYENLSYEDYKKQTPEAVCNLLCAFHDMVNYTKSYRGVPAPGICAEYGYLLLKPTTAEYFAAAATNAQKKVFGNVNYSEYFNGKGLEMLEKEMELYPESKAFLEPLLKHFKGEDQKKEEEK